VSKHHEEERGEHDGGRKGHRHDLQPVEKRAVGHISQGDNTAENGSGEHRAYRGAPDENNRVQWWNQRSQTERRDQE